MYLVELTFDVQSLKMYTKYDYQNSIPPEQELKQLSDESSRCRRILILKIATWITNHLHTSDTKIINSTVFNTSVNVHRSKNDSKKYRINKDLEFFAQYAALELMIKGWEIS